MMNGKVTLRRKSMPLKSHQLMKIYQAVRVNKTYKYKPIRNTYNLKSFG